MVVIYWPFLCGAGSVGVGAGGGRLRRRAPVATAARRNDPGRKSRNFTAVAARFAAVTVTSSSQRSGVLLPAVDEGERAGGERQPDAKDQQSLEVVAGGVAGAPGCRR